MAGEIPEAVACCCARWPQRPIDIALSPMAALPLSRTVFRKPQSRSRTGVVLSKLQSVARPCVRSMAAAVSVAWPARVRAQVGAVGFIPKLCVLRMREKDSMRVSRSTRARDSHPLPDAGPQMPALCRRSPYFIPEARQHQRSPARRSRSKSRRRRCDARAVQSRARHPSPACSRSAACERVASVALPASIPCTTPAIAHDRMPSRQVVRVASQSWSFALCAWLPNLPPMPSSL